MHSTWQLQVTTVHFKVQVRSFASQCAVCSVCWFLLHTRMGFAVLSTLSNVSSQLSALRCHWRPLAIVVVDVVVVLFFVFVVEVVMVVVVVVVVTVAAVGGV